MTATPMFLLCQFDGVVEASSSAQVLRSDLRYESPDTAQMRFTIYFQHLTPAAGRPSCEVQIVPIQRHIILI